MNTRSYGLVCTGFEPPFVRLDQKREYMVGRDPRADLFLPSRQVSRRHAKISWSEEERGFAIRDLFSRRAFLINGSRVERRVLRDADEIIIEPYHLRFRVYEGDLGALIEPRAGALPSDFRLAGRWSGAELLDILAYVDIADLSAVLQVDGDKQSGTIAVAGGQMVSADAGFLKSSRAAQALLMSDRGSFELRAGEVQPAAGQTPMPISRLLSEILARMSSESTTIDLAGVQEADIMRLERRLRAAEAEKQLRALVQKERMLEEDVARARELQQRSHSALPDDPRVGFAAASRPAAALGATIHVVTALGAQGYRVLLAEALGGGMEAFLHSMVIKSEWDLVNDDDLRAVDALTMLYRRLPQRAEPIGFNAACLDVVFDDDIGARVTYVTERLPDLIHCQPGGIAPRHPEPVEAGDGGGARLASIELHPARGDRLVLTTSGLVKQLGMPRLLAALDRAGKLDAKATVDALLAAARGATTPEGDVEVVTVEIR